MRAIMLLLVLCSLVRVVAAQAPTGDAKRYFDAGNIAHELGEYQAAVQAFESAYRLQPGPEVAFFLAQAERSQYFATRRPVHIENAIDLYHTYLSQVPTGGRRAEVTHAVGQLEPIALAHSLERAGDFEAGPAGPLAPKTRLMVLCKDPDARVVLDGAEAVASPLIAETTPGPHRLRIDAKGFVPLEQEIVAIEGQLMPYEFALHEQPTVVIVKAPDGTDVYVDGVLARPVAKTGQLKLRAGQYSLALAKKGHELVTLPLTLTRGQTRTVAAGLHWSDQRVLALSLLAVAGAGLITGSVMTGLALDREATAHGIQRRRRTAAISPAEWAAYGGEVDARGDFRLAAVASLTVGLGALVTGLLLYQFDDSRPAPSTPQLGVSPVPGGVMVSVGTRGRL